MTEYQPSEFANSGFGDQINIQTPEQVDLRFPIAGVGSRFVALLIDHLIQSVIIIAIALFAAAARNSGVARTQAPDGDLTTGGKWIVGIFIFLNFLLIWGYFTLFEAYWKGQTPGKRLMKLRVIKDSGRQITLFEAMARNLVRIVDSLPSFYLIGVVTMVCNKRNKRLGDMAAGTIVVHEVAVDDRPAEVFLGGGGNFFAKPEVVYDERLPADTVSRLDMNDLHVIETFFSRALDLDEATRASIAQRIAARMAAKMGVPVPDGNPERMLEDIAKAMRSSGRRF